MNQIIIYKNDDKSIAVEANIVNDSIWLTQKQIATVFGTEVPAINKHIKNILKAKELTEDSTISKMEIVRQEGKRRVTRNIEIYNLDMIISVGYRVNSNRATRFRIWATQRLKDYLVKGYALNEKRLKEATGNLNDLQKALKLAARAGNNENLSSVEAKGILGVLEQYAYALETLDRFDHQRLTIDVKTKGKSKSRLKKLTYENAKKEIAVWKNYQKAGDLFGNEKDHSLKSSLNSIYQTIGKKEVYPTIEEKAANLLYFIVKNHSFTDGNKRIAAGLFVYFLDMNNALNKQDGNKIIEDNALVAITIMIAESKSAEKDIMVKLVVNLISRNN